jgi:hypothetical protein
MDIAGEDLVGDDAIEIAESNVMTIGEKGMLKFGGYTQVDGNDLATSLITAGKIVAAGGGTLYVQWDSAHEQTVVSQKERKVLNYDLNDDGIVDEKDLKMICDDWLN